MVLDENRVHRPDERGWLREHIGPQLDVYAQRHGLNSLRDRLNIGLNPSAMLAVPEIRNLFEEVCIRLSGSESAGRDLLAEAERMTLDIQKHGPWAYADELVSAGTPRAQAWYILAGAEAVGYEKEQLLNPAEFDENVNRIYDFLAESTQDPERKLGESRAVMLSKAERLIRFQEGDKDKMAPIGEGWATSIPMAAKGYKAGIWQDATGDVFVMSSKPLSDEFIASCGLSSEVKRDDHDPNRFLTYYIDASGRDILKKVHDGLLVVVTQNLDLACSIVSAINRDSAQLNLSEDLLGHRVVEQATERRRADFKDVLQAHYEKMEGVRDALRRVYHPDHDESPVTPPNSGGLVRSQDEFLGRLLEVRSQYVYLDALNLLELKARARGGEVSREEKERLAANTREKVRVKIEEVKRMLDVVDGILRDLPESVTAIRDFAGGAGDLSLAVAERMFSAGRDVSSVEVVDPMDRASLYMDMLVQTSPMADRLSPIVHHNGDLLQHVDINANEIVVAKHACGTLSDDVIEKWIKSESPVLEMMTCCQETAIGQASKYGFSQMEWDKLCELSALTKVEIPDTPGEAREEALAKLQKGQQAITKLNIARVEYLRRLGFKADLFTNPQFKNGDIIVARRLPSDFMNKLFYAKRLQRSDEKRFHKFLEELRRMTAKREPTSYLREELGDDWTGDDLLEFYNRVSGAYNNFRLQFDLQDVESELEAVSFDALQAKEDEARRNAARKAAKGNLFKILFRDVKGGISGYVKSRFADAGKTPPLHQEFGAITAQLNTLIDDSLDLDPAEVRRRLDGLLDQIIDES